jgi:hypothetical protein
LATLGKEPDNVVGSQTFIQKQPAYSAETYPHSIAKFLKVGNTCPTTYLIFKNSFSHSTPLPIFATKKYLPDD